ncbi:unnamed protein product, partial [Prorocentrum cordatum]
PCLQRPLRVHDLCIGTYILPEMASQSVEIDSQEDGDTCDFSLLVQHKDTLEDMQTVAAVWTMWFNTNGKPKYAVPLMEDIERLTIEIAELLSMIDPVLGGDSQPEWGCEPAGVITRARAALEKYEELKPHAKNLCEPSKPPPKRSASDPEPPPPSKAKKNEDQKGPADGEATENPEEK